MAAHPSTSRIHSDLFGMKARPVGPALLELRCTDCGYGARCAVAPERCPMCSGSSWVFVARTGFHEADAVAPLARDR
jgi:rubrerythrin